MESNPRIHDYDMVPLTSAPPLHRILMRYYQKCITTVCTVEKNWLEFFVKQHLNDANVIHEMFVATDTDCDGRITFVEFLKMMQEYDLTRTMLRLYDDIDNGVFTVFSR
ncbi:hypothetical protein KIN20_016677 [Parelaphostrongylus tenuis]|uniref:EF-hand domain-containing protein n=1 Tax=Parelaphostrongylus tenuis TaxID=148309 RepID=A0AAD5MZZ7_PARTN|nr:hypothetical protein KIN20_016677 [Parelaphostrongylus tenuis]